MQISEELEDIGANINAYTAKDCTCFHTKGSSDDLEKCIDVLSDMYFNATVPQEELDREKGVVTEEIKLSEDTPDDVSQDLVSSAIFYRQPLGQTILGSVENIKNAERADILQFKRQHYLPASTVIAVCGKFDVEQLDRLVERYFEQYCSQNVTAPQEEPQVQYCSEFLHSFKKIEQTHLQLAWGGFSLKSPQRYAANLLTSILGGGLSSRLNQEIREKNGLAYSVYCYPSYYTNCGTVEIYVGLSPENNAKVCRLIKSELNKLLDGGITCAELQRAKAQAINALYMNIESNFTLMRLYGRSMLKLNEVFDAQADVEKYKSVTAENVNDIARTIFERPYASAYVGPKISDYNVVSTIELDKRQ